MSDPESELSPEREEQVRRLLAQARVAEPTPDHVVARLDGVLSDLAAPVAVMDLAARRRRRARGLLLAAAAVVVIGVGVGELVGAGPDSPTGADTSSSAEQAPQDAPDRASGDAGAQSGPDSVPLEDASPKAAAPVPEDSGRGHATDEVSSYAVRLGGGGLARSVRAVVRAAEGAPTGADGFVELRPGTTGSGVRFVDDFACTPADWGPGRLIPVRYQGTPNVLALRAVEGESQVVEVLQCGTGEIVRSLTLPAR